MDGRLEGDSRNTSTFDELKMGVSGQTGPVDGLVAFLSDEHGLERNVADALKLWGRLEQLTGWDEGELLASLACDTVRHRARDKNEAERALTLSARFFDWLIELIRSADTRPETRLCREIVVGAVDLFLSAGDAPGDARLAECRAAFARRDGLDYTADDYLRLGEVTRAWHIAALGLAPETAARKRADRLERTWSSVDGRSHVHPARLRAAFERNGDEVLGPGVTHAVRQHYQRCEACKAAAPGLDPSVSAAA